MRYEVYKQVYKGIKKDYEKTLGVFESILDATKCIMGDSHEIEHPNYTIKVLGNPELIHEKLQKEGDACVYDEMWWDIYDRITQYYCIRIRVVE